MKPSDFEIIMRKKYELRTQSTDYVEEANKDLIFIKHFKNYIRQVKAFTDKKELHLFGMPFYNIKNESLEFKLDKFDDYLQKKRVNMARVDLVLKCRGVLKAKKYRGKYKEHSCSSYKIEKYNVDESNLIIDGEAEEIMEVKQIEHEQS